MTARLIRQAGWLAEFLNPNPRIRRDLRTIRNSGHFDRAFYLRDNPHLHPLFRRFPERHYLVFGEREGRRPHPAFSARAYLRHNPDLSDWAGRGYVHFLLYGRHEQRLTLDLSQGTPSPLGPAPSLRAEHDRRAPHAVVAHVYYHDLWPELAAALGALDIPFDLYVTVTDRGDGAAEPLAAAIRADFPGAMAVVMPNRGRDIFPFVHLVNAGLFDGYVAVAKIHSKRSLHRSDGDAWRQALIRGILPGPGTAEKLNAFLGDEGAGLWVADGQHYSGAGWWGANQDRAATLLRRIGISPPVAPSFPAGSMYWLKPVILAMIRGLRLDQTLFEPETGQVDGTLAHAFERAIGAMVADSGLRIRETAALGGSIPPRPRASFVSAFYLPQFHRTEENDRWWGTGYTEWQAAARARPQFDGHDQPALPGALGFYDLTRPEVMGEQAALARRAGIDAFCVYHYWFDGRRMLNAPMEGLLARPEIDFPFYLCWANESWRRNWDGLSGEVLVEQTYAPGFEEGLAVSTLPYLRDARYGRPDGSRPRFVIYRPEDLPDPVATIARLRAAWRALGLGAVELGAVRFHLDGPHPVPSDAVDFWVEMPPHGLVAPPDYLHGGPDGNRMQPPPAPGFQGLIYDLNAVIDRSLSPGHAASLPPNTIAGVMPGWDNTARRGAAAHIAHGAHPGAFRRWLHGLSDARLATSYRGEVMLNAWNEWGEKAVLEPCLTWGNGFLDVLRDWR